MFDKTYCYDAIKYYRIMTILLHSSKLDLQCLLLFYVFCQPSFLIPSVYENVFVAVIIMVLFHY